MSAAAERDLTEGALPGHFAALAIPAAIGLAFSTLYNVVDVWFAGRIGTDAQAGLSIAGTVFFVLVAGGFGVGAGVNALIGNALGARDRPGAARLGAQGLAFAALMAAALSLGGAFGTGAVLDALGASGPPRAAAEAYLAVLLFATPFFLMAYACNGICAAQGDARSFQRALAGAFAANCVLNPAFVWGLGLGLPGIAWATVAAQAGAAAWMLRRALTSRAMAGAPWRAFVPRAADMAEIARQALPASFNMLTITLGAFIIQRWLQPFGAAAVAGYGVALRIEQIVLLPGFGITGALLPIVAQNHGARLDARVADAMRFALRLGAGLMAAAAVAITLGGRAALAAFTDDPEVIAQGWSYLAFARWMLPAYFALFAVTAYLQAIKRPMLPVWIGVYRQLFALSAFGWLFTGPLGLGVEGVWWSILAAVFSGLALAASAALLARRWEGARPRPATG